MSEYQIFGLFQVIAVLALVVVAAVLATPPNKVPLALRGLMRIMKKDRGLAADGAGAGRVPVGKRLLAFVLVLIAFALASIAI